MKRIFIDLDGVLADFFRRALAMYDVDIDQCDAKRLAGGWVPTICNTTEEEFWSHIDYDWWLGLQPMPDMLDILDIAEQHGETCILTSPGNDPSGCSGKKAWIDKYLPHYRDRCLIGKPKHMCAGPGAYLLDDWRQQTAKFASYGGKGILVPRLWNEFADKDTLEWINHALQD